MLYKFSGAGNDFVVMDGRDGDVSAFRDATRIGELSREYGTDGLMILGEAPGVDFEMEFYNPDGSGGMMCGNGGRCIVAFADYLGIRPADGELYSFLAPDGLHRASILEGPACSDAGTPAGERGSGEVAGDMRWTVRLQMIDVKECVPARGGWFLNTGTRHLVLLVDDIEAVDMESTAKPLRWDAEFQPEGTNVNFVQLAPDGLHVRTFEKGVEGETLACGTGLTAAAIAVWKTGGSGTSSPRTDGRIAYRLQCRRGDWLSVDFLPDLSSVHLTGPAELVSIG